MTNIAKEIQKARRISRMRLGQESPDFHVIPSTRTADDPVRVALVPLTEKELDRGFGYVAGLDLPDNETALNIRDRQLMTHNLWSAVRDPSDLSEKAFSSMEEMVDTLEAGDINYLGEMFQALIEETSPALDGLSPEDLEDLKKAFARIDLNVLSGRSWAHLKRFFSTLAADQLLGNSRLLISTFNSIGTSESSESTPTAETN